MVITYWRLVYQQYKCYFCYSKNKGGDNINVASMLKPPIKNIIYEAQETLTTVLQHYHAQR